MASGALGRSKYYGRLLRYLADAALKGEQPKEIELAIDVLGKEPAFDVSIDSSVRVYIHQLRKKLDAFYRQDSGRGCRLAVAKGQYTLVAITQNSYASKSAQGTFWGRVDRSSALLSLCAVLLAANLAFTLWDDREAAVSRYSKAAIHPIWSEIISDDQPILLVMGDYYIFGELNANGNITRMVREFDINSPNDLEELQFTDLARSENFLDLNLSYMPEGSAYALTKIAPLLESSGKTVNVSMMSDLTSADMHDNHIVYIGYISALDKLSEMTFASSGLQLGRSYDELFDRDSLQYFTSDAGLPAEGAAFKDYGMFSLFSTSSNTKVVIIAGMRDAGLMHTAKALSDFDSLDDLAATVGFDNSRSLASFEALYEVFGVDRLNFDANLVYSNTLDPKQIWTKSLRAGTRAL